MKVIGVLAYFVIGLIQAAAMFAGFMSSLGRFFGFVLALVLGEVPILGSVMGFIGAIRAWDWPWWGAALLFIVAPIALMIWSSIAFRND